MSETITKKVIIIFGAPGSGKTTFSLSLSGILNATPVISSDLIRDFIALNNKDNLILDTTSHSAWELFGEPTESNVIKGFKSHNKEVWKYLLPLIDSTLNKYKIVIAEGTHFDDEIYKILEQKAWHKYYIFLELNRVEIDKIYDNKSLQRTNNNNPWLLKKPYIFWIDDFLKNFSSRLMHQKNFFQDQIVYSLKSSDLQSYFIKISKSFKNSSQTTIKNFFN